MIDYNYYKTIHLGDKVDNESTFNKLLAKSKRTLNLYTMDRVKRVTDEEILELIRVTLCELVDIQSDIDRLESMGDVKSMSQGKRSVSYFTPGELGIDNVKSKQYGVIRENLLLTGLLTRSVMR